MSSTLGILTLVIGLIFNLLGCIGLIRLPDVYNRLQAATKCVTLGTCMVLASVAIMAGGHPPMVIKALLCLTFVLLTAPTAAHALARGAHASGVRLWEGSVMDRYRDDHEPGVESKDQP